jgi:group I intron endonuclease
MKSGIYQFLNTVTGKCYVGQAVNLHKRKREHFATLRAGRHNSAKLQRSWVKYGAGTFVFEVLELVKDKDLLMKAEQKWIDALKAYENGYNIQPYACRGCFGMIISAETRAKTSATLKGRKISPECLRKRIGQKRSPEVKARMTEGQLRRYEVARLAA